MAINERATVEVQVNGEQAKNELRNLESYANSLKGRLAEAYASGDTKKIKALEKELRETNKQLRIMRTNARNIDEAMNNIGLATPKELKTLIRDINARLNSGHVKRGSAEWNKYQQQLRLVLAEQRRVNGEIRESQSLFARINTGFSKYAALGASVIATITGVSLALSKMRNNRNEKEASSANVKALTGLDDKDIQWLTRQADILSTTMEQSGLRVKQSSTEILEAYMLVGWAKPELREDREALNAVTIETLRLSRAANMDLKAAVEGVTLSMNQYGAGADQAEKYTNVMAAGSKVGAAAVNSITAAVKKAGITAAGAEVPIEQLVGTIETLAEKGIKDEVAGTGLKMFFLKLQTGADDTNPKIVGLQTALQNLKKLDEQGIVKRFGAETFSVAKALIDGADRVEYFTQAVTDTNIAVEQAAINSATAEAKMAQYKNQIKEAGIELMERLNPSLSMLVGWSTKFIQAAPVMIDWIKKYGKVIVYATIVIASYTIAKKAHWFWLNKVKTETGQYIIIQKLKQFWDKAVTASTWLYIAATSALTGKMKQAKLAMQAVNLVLKVNPFVALATAVVAVAGAFYLLSRRASGAERAARSMLLVQQESVASIQDEKVKLDSLWAIASDVNESMDARKKAMSEINAISPKYLGNITLETINTDAAKKSMDKYIQSLVRKATIERELQRLAEINAQMAKYGYDPSKYLQEEVGAFRFLWDSFTTDSPIPQWEQWVKESEKLTEDIKRLQSEDLSETATIGNEKNPCAKCGNAPCTCLVVATTNDERLLAQERKYQEELKAIKEAYLKDASMTQEEYARLNEDAELSNLHNMLAIAGLEADERMKIEQRILDAKIKFKQKCLAEDKKADEESKKNETKSQEEAFLRRQKQYEIEIYDATLQHYKLKTSEEDFKDALKSLQDSYFQDILSSTEVSEKAKEEIRKIYRERVLTEEEQNYKEATEKLDNMKRNVQDFAMSVGDSFGEMFANEEFAMKDFFKSTLILTLDFIQKTLIAEQAAAIAKITFKEIATKGFAGLATAAGKIALITAAFQTAKGILGNFYTGGFTSPGEWDKPQGIVHSNEFVANRFAVGNPAVMPVLKLLDTAQKNNTVGSLTTRDISNALGHSQGTNSSESVQYIQSNDLAIKTMVSECVSVMKAVKDRLDKPIYSINTISGRSGVKKALDDYDLLIKNKKRKP